MTEVGRNAPCWCGSGKKYKKCHYATDSIPKAQPFWIQMRFAEGELQRDIEKYFEKTYEHDIILLACDEFYGAVEIEPIKEELDNVVALWALSPWSPLPTAKGKGFGKSVAKLYLEAKETDLSDLKKRILTTLDGRPFSFYQVREATLGVSMHLRDLLTGDEWTVMDRAGSDPKMLGRIFYARVVPLDDTAIMMGCAPFPFDPNWITHIQELRTIIKPRGTPKVKDLFDFEKSIRNLYLQFRNLHLNPPKPQMANTDGDPLEFQSLTWKHAVSIESAVEALMPLTLDTRDQVKGAALTNSDGSLKVVEIHWSKKWNKTHKGMANTLLGKIIVGKGTITAEVNSQKRATKLRKEVEKRLAGLASFEKAVIESFDAKIREMKDRVPTKEEPKSPEERAAIQEAVAAMQKKHWDTWIDQEILALGGLKPRKAVTFKEGREQVEALLFSFEESNRRAPDELKVDVAELRRKLKL